MKNINKDTFHLLMNTLEDEMRERFIKMLDIVCDKISSNEMNQLIYMWDECLNDVKQIRDTIVENSGKETQGIFLDLSFKYKNN